MFQSIYHRRGGLFVDEHATYEQALEKLQYGAEFGSLYGHGIYDVERGVVYYPHWSGNKSRFDLWHQEVVMEALGLDSAPEVAGLYDTFPPD